VIGIDKLVYVIYTLQALPFLSNHIFVLFRSTINQMMTMSQLALVHLVSVLALVPPQNHLLWATKTLSCPRLNQIWVDW